MKESDGVLFGSPTRYGNMDAQMKALIGSTAQLWLTGAMEGKPAGVFTSTASTHGGQDTTLLTMIVPLLHLGMVIVGVPYSTAGMIHTEARGGTPYGATTIAGPQGELQPAPEDLASADGSALADSSARPPRSRNGPHLFCELQQKARTPLNTLEAELRRRIRLSLLTGDVTATQIAAELGVNTRMLLRRLREFDVSFQGLLNEMRHLRMPGRSASENATD